MTRDAEPLDRYSAATEPRSNRPRHLFPLVRHLSCRVSPWLAETTLTPNQITIAGHLVGLLGVVCFLSDEVGIRVVGGLAFLVRALLYHCDGEVARLTGNSSRFGDLLSELGGSAVQIVLWPALGWKFAGVFGDPIWLWFGVSAALGVVVNLACSLRFKVHAAEQETTDGDLALSVRPDTLSTDATWRDRALYAFRELLPADLWLLLFVLGVSNTLWILLPATAVGVHVYWLVGLLRSARRFHA